MFRWWDFQHPVAGERREQDQGLVDVGIHEKDLGCMVVSPEYRRVFEEWYYLYDEGAIWSRAMPFCSLDWCFFENNAININMAIQKKGKRENWASYSGSSMIWKNISDWHDKFERWWKGLRHECIPRGTGVHGTTNELRRWGIIRFIQADRGILGDTELYEDY